MAQRVVVETKDSWLDYVVAFGTAGAALIAVVALLVTLYLNVWREHQLQPRLSLSLSPTSEHGALFEAYAEHPGRHDSIHAVTLDVSNARGGRTAHDVEVLLSVDLYLPGPAEDAAGFMPRDELDHQPLTWATGLQPGDPGVTTIRIAAGVTKRIVVCYLGHEKSLWAALPPYDSWPHDRLARGSLGILAIPPLRQDAPRERWLSNEQGKYMGIGCRMKLRFTISASNADAVIYSTEVHIKNDEGVTFPTWRPLQREHARPVGRGEPVSPFTTAGP